MKPETRQTLIGVTGLTIVQVVALMEGFNGRVMTAYIIAVTGIVAPQAVEHIPILGRRR